VVSFPTMSNEYTMIASNDALQELATLLLTQSCIAVDTEFVWERTFYAQLGLVQIGLADGTCYLIDPLAIDDMTPLGTVLADPQVTKILHDAPQDLMILRRATGSTTHNIFDTRRAAGFAGISSVISLQGVIDELVGVLLPKGHSRTNWLRRPLSPEQLDYAVDDVLYLPKAVEELRKRARERNTEAWMDAELATLDASELYEDRPPESYYLRIKTASSLRSPALAALRELAAWREATARKLDRPRKHIAEDRELVSVAKVSPKKIGELRHCQHLGTRTAQYYGENLIAAVQRSTELDPAEVARPAARPDSRHVGKERVDALVIRIRECCEGRGVDPALIGSKADVTCLVHDADSGSLVTSPLMSGWRGEAIGETVHAFFEHADGAPALPLF
jgi:ribonuclease D